MPAVSIIIPVYNVEKYLRRCLDSVLGQTFPDWEAICVNDGSPDGSRAIVEEYAKADPRFILYDKPNGGLSDARNFGLSKAGGEYVVFLDSDDFIHPQTFEIALGLAARNNTDIVSWYKDPNYRNLTMLRHFLRLDTLRYRPAGFRRRFSIDKVRCCRTEDIMAHVTECSHPKGIKWPLKHFYVWRHLIRREVLDGVSFIKGITFEDFPWWSEVLLKNPSVTITYLPFYYYYPNFKSIDLGSSRVKKMKNWCAGLEYSFALYAAEADSRQMDLWSANCKWPVINVMIGRWLPKFDSSSAECSELVLGLERLWNAGAFEDVRDERGRRSREAVARFIGK